MANDKQVNGGKERGLQTTVGGVKSEPQYDSHLNSEGRVQALCREQDGPNSQLLASAIMASARRDLFGGAPSNDVSTSTTSSNHIENVSSTASDVSPQDKLNSVHERTSQGTPVRTKNDIVGNENQQHANTLADGDGVGMVGGVSEGERRDGSTPYSVARAANVEDGTGTAGPVGRRRSDASLLDDGSPSVPDPSWGDSMNSPSTRGSLVPSAPTSPEMAAMGRRLFGEDVDMVSKEVILQRIESTDGEIAMAEKKLDRLKGEHKEADHALSSMDEFAVVRHRLEQELGVRREDAESRLSESEEAVVCRVWRDNQRMAQKSHTQARLPAEGEHEPWHDVFVVQRIEDIEFYQENLLVANELRPSFMKFLKSKLLAKKMLENQLREFYRTTMETWTKKLEAEAQVNKAKTQKARAYFEKEFPDMKQPKTDYEVTTSVQRALNFGAFGSVAQAPQPTGRGGRASRIGGWGDVVRSDAEMEQVLEDLLAQDRHDANRYETTAATVPGMILDRAERERYRYVDTNGLIPDLPQVAAHHKTLVYWEPHEQHIFTEKFLQHPKNFARIAVFLPGKSISDCVAYYYASKKKVGYKAMVIANLGTKKRKPTMDQVEAYEETPPPSRQETPATSARGPKTKPAKTRERALSRENLGDGVKETASWQDEEIEQAKELLRLHGRNWGLMSKEIGTKTEAQCKNFYHNYKRRLNLESVIDEFEQRRRLSVDNQSEDGKNKDSGDGDDDRDRKPKRKSQSIDDSTTSTPRKGSGKERKRRRMNEDEEGEGEGEGGREGGEDVEQYGTPTEEQPKGRKRKARTREPESEAGTPKPPGEEQDTTSAGNGGGEGGGEGEGEEEQPAQGKAKRQRGRQRAKLQETSTVESPPADTAPPTPTPAPQTTTSANVPPPPTESLSETSASVGKTGASLPLAAAPHTDVGMYGEGLVHTGYGAPAQPADRDTRWPGIGARPPSPPMIPYARPHLPTMEGPPRTPTHPHGYYGPPSLFGTGIGGIREGGTHIRRRLCGQVGYGSPTVTSQHSPRWRGARA